MTKTYNSPMLQVVSIKKSDVIATSAPGYGGTTDETSGNLATDRFTMFGDNWANAGY